MIDRFEQRGGIYTEPRRKKVKFSIDQEAGRQLRELTQQDLDLMRSRKKIKDLTLFQIMKQDRARLILILVNSMGWMVKLLDFVLFNIWQSLPRKDGGLGFSSVEAGAVNLLSCPMICLTIITCFKMTKKKSGSYWLVTTNFLFLGTQVILPLCNILMYDHETRLFFTILVVAVKEGSYLLYQSTWNTMVSKAFSSNILGKVLSFSFFIGHLLLVFASLIYPPLMTFFTKNQYLRDKLGKTRFAVFFGFLGLPVLASLILTIKMRLIFQNRDNVKI